MSSLDKGLRVLGLLGEGRRALRVSEVAESLGLPKSSVSRLLATLGEHGFVDRVSGHGGFEPGYQLLRLGALVRTDDRPLELAEAALRDLVARHPVTGYIAMLEGVETIILRVRESASPIRYVVSEGTRLPAYVTAIGKSLLMRLDAQELASRLPERLNWPALKFQTSRAALLRDLHICRAQGYAELQDMARRGIGAVAVSVAAPSSRPLGVALCWMDREVGKAPRQRIVRELLAVGRSIGRQVQDPYWQ